MEKKLFFPRELGVQLHNWHIGQGDPIYAAGSSIYAGLGISEELRDDAIRSLKSARNQTDKRSLKRELSMLIKALGWPESEI
jgi:hypothetical protein